MNVQDFARAVAAEFRAVGIYRGSDQPERDLDGKVHGPVCFWVNNTGTPPLAFRSALDAPDGLIYFLEYNTDEYVLEALDRVAEGN